MCSWCSRFMKVFEAVVTMIQARPRRWSCRWEEGNASVQERKGRSLINRARKVNTSNKMIVAAPPISIWKPKSYDQGSTTLVFPGWHLPGIKLGVLDFNPVVYVKYELADQGNFRDNVEMDKSPLISIRILVLPEAGTLDSALNGRIRWLFLALSQVCYHSKENVLAPTRWRDSTCMMSLDILDAAGIAW